jgi:hypothetical protein
MFPHIVDSNDVGVVTEPPHGPGFAADAGSRGIIQFLGLDEGKGNVPVQEGVMDEVDLLLPPLPEEFLYGVAPVDEGRGGNSGWSLERRSS